MRKVTMLLLVLVGGCLMGCMATVKLGQTSVVMESLPLGIWAVNITVSSFESVTSFDAVKGIEMAVDGVKSLIVGLVPLG